MMGSAVLLYDAVRWAVSGLGDLCSLQAPKPVRSSNEGGMLERYDLLAQALYQGQQWTIFAVRVRCFQPSTRASKGILL